MTSISSCGGQRSHEPSCRTIKQSENHPPCLPVHSANLKRTHEPIGALQDRVSDHHPAIPNECVRGGSGLPGAGFGGKEERGQEEGILEVHHDRHRINSMSRSANYNKDDRLGLFLSLRYLLLPPFLSPALASSLPTCISVAPSPTIRTSW